VKVEATRNEGDKLKTPREPAEGLVAATRAAAKDAKIAGSNRAGAQEGAVCPLLRQMCLL